MIPPRMKTPSFMAPCPSPSDASAAAWNSAISRRVTGPGVPVAHRPVVDPGHRQHAADGAGQEHLVGRAQLVRGQELHFLRGQPVPPAQLQHLASG